MFTGNKNIKELEGKEQIESLKNPNVISYVYIYHPDCIFCKKSAPDWDRFANDFGSKYINQTKLQIGAINLSNVKNRKDANAS